MNAEQASIVRVSQNEVVTPAPMGTVAEASRVIMAPMANVIEPTFVTMAPMANVVEPPIVALVVKENVGQAPDANAPPIVEPSMAYLILKPDDREVQTRSDHAGSGDSTAARLNVNMGPAATASDLTIVPVTTIAPSLHRHRIFSPYAPNCVPCLPPPMPATPATPATPVQPKKSDDAKLPAERKDAAPNQDQVAAATEAGAQPGAMFNPYMFGDQFGSRGSNLSLTVGTLTGQSFLTGNGTAPSTATINNPAAPLSIPITNAILSAANGGSNNFTLPQHLPAVATSPTPLNTTATTIGNATQAYIILFPLPGVSFGGGGVPLQNNAAVQQYIDSIFKNKFGNSGQTVFQSANLSAAAGTTGTPLNVTPAQINFAPGSQVYYTYSYVANISLPLPSSGGVVGTTKLSENNSPMPRDRLIFDYDYFTNVPITAGGYNVSRFSPGFEKTFFNGRASVQLRLPFAATVDPNSVAGGATASAAEFGDVHTTFKALFYASKVYNVSTGLGIALPTASDTRVQMANGSDLVRIKNESVILTPYVAGLYTPNDRFFSQAWAQINFDANGSPVYGNPNLTGLVGAGRIYDQVLLQLDAQVGYWLVRDPNAAFLTGLAPFFEMHYNTPLNNASVVQAGSFSVGSLGGRYNELNLATGVNATFRNRLSLMAGIVLPVENGSSRFFDAQFGVRCNWLFGPSTRASAVSNY